jgi:6-phosphogluconolactonase
MRSNDVQHRRDTVGLVSRRGLLRGAAALAAAGSAVAPAQNGTALAYIGCYTPNGQGIYLFSMNPFSGVLSQVTVFTGPGTSNPSWLALHPSKKYLYAVNENSPGTVSAFNIGANGNLTFLNTVSAQGNGPAHMSVDPSGQYALVANYGSGNVTVIQILSNGSLGAATDVKADIGACTPACVVGPTKAAKAPPGSFAVSGHDAPHAHMIETDPAGNFVIVNDLGLDLTIVWAFNKITGKLSSPQTFPSSPGAGPRHFAFHPNGRWLYSLNEEASTLAFMTYNATTGALTLLQEIQTLPPAFVGTNFTSEVRISQNGNYIYAANRLHDTIAVFSIEASGMLTMIGEEWTRGDYPRSFTIDPSGSYMYVCNHRGDSVTSFRLYDGAVLEFTGQYTAVGSPAVMVFL